MKKLLSVLFILVMVACKAQMVPQSKKVTEKYFPDPEMTINTPAFQKKKGYTNHEELIAFLEKQVSEHPDLISLTYLGESQKGKKVPMIVLNKKVSTAPKVKVWIQGGLHGNEMGSSESVLFMIDQLLNNEKYNYLLDRLEIGIVPMANIDGYEKEDRYAANGLDLNRDQTKLNIQESIFLKQAFSDFKAEVALDFHEYKPYRKDFSGLSTFGVAGYYDVMFLYSGNLNVPKSLRDYTKFRFVSAAENKLDSAGLSHHDYMSTTKNLGSVHFNLGSENSRSSATSYALTNCVSSLIEVRGVDLARTSFKRRINTAFIVGLSYLETAYNNGEELKNEIRQAVESESIAVLKTKKFISERTIQLIDIDKSEVITMEVTIRDALQLTPITTRARAKAYLILPEQLAVIEKLQILGLKIAYLQQDQTAEVEQYTIDSYERSAEKYEGVNQQTVTTKVELTERIFPKGTAIVYMNQANANLATEVLEPEVSNSFVSFEVIPTEAGAILPIYRYLKTDVL